VLNRAGDGDPAADDDTARLLGGTWVLVMSIGPRLSLSHRNLMNGSSGARAVLPLLHARGVLASF